MRIQRMCAESEDELGGTARRVQADPDPRSLPAVTPHVQARIDRLRGRGSPIPGAARGFFEDRFGRDFGAIRVHAGPAAADTARELGARAFTVARDIFFGAGEYSPDTRRGRSLLAHELTHVVQQRAAGAGVLQRDPCDNDAIVGQGPSAIPRLESRRSRHGAPCACLVFVHNDETNARRAVEALHDNCQYNLAIIQSGTGRNVPVPGEPRECDPNELFPQDILRECTDDPAACERYVANHNNLEATQKQFVLAVQECSNRFRLPTIALHNNRINDTEAIRSLGRDHRLAVLLEDIDRGTESGRGSLEDLRGRLERLSEGGTDLTRLLERGGSTNIIRWCALPEIARCHIGDPWHPDHVVWTTNPRDYERLSRFPVNVVLQARQSAETAAAGESETDLSSLFLHLGGTARYINIETPIAPTTRAARRGNIVFILTVLERLGLVCCEGPAEEAPASRGAGGGS